MSADPQSAAARKVRPAQSSAGGARIPLSVPDLRGREKAYLAACIDDNWISSAGPQIPAFERAVAHAAGAAHGVALVNGTCALELALRVAGVRAGMAVLVPDWTFVATANAVRHIGAEPHFVDVTAESWTLDPALAAEALAGSERPVGAIVPVHALGHPADLDPIRALAAAHGVPVVEDGAGAIGARYKGGPVGAGAAPAVMFSFNGNKLLTAGAGGALVTDDAAFAERARLLSAQARRGDAYRHEELAFNYRMSNVNAAVGLAQAERLDEMTAARRATAAAYRAALDGSRRLVFMPRADWAEPNGWMSVVHCADAATASALIEAMDEAGIDARSFWEPLSEQPAYRNSPRTLAGVAARFTGRTVALPCSSSLTAADRARVIAVLERFR